MLPRKHLDRIQVAFDDQHLMDNAGLLSPSLLGSAPRSFPTRRLSPRSRQRDGPGQHRRQDADVGRFRAGWRRLHRRRRYLAPRWDGLRYRLRGLRRHPPWAPSCAASGGGPRQSTRPRELQVTGPGLTAILNSDGSITLTWSARDDGSVAGYHVLLRRPREGEETLIVYVSDTGNTATTYTDTGTDLDTRYGYHAKARNAHGRSDVSNFARIDT